MTQCMFVHTIILRKIYLESFLIYKLPCQAKMTYWSENILRAMALK